MLPNIFPGLNTGLGELANMPPVLPINDPANLNSSNPAVAAAAAAKRDEDAAPQKIAALEYLATRGCTSCVPGAEEAMLSGLEDCTESVRFAAATAIYETAGKPCRVCKAGNCCTPKIREKLWELGFKVDENTGCPVEPSPRVRREARLALRACGPDCTPPVPPAPRPSEGPDLDLPTPVNPAAPVPPAPALDPQPLAPPVPPAPGLSPGSSAAAPESADPPRIQGGVRRPRRVRQEMGASVYLGVRARHSIPSPLRGEG
jgi:hypothetical protein